MQPEHGAVDGLVRFPPDYPAHLQRQILDPLNNPSASARPELGHPQWRREVTRTDPVRFALLYLPHLLHSPETRNRISLNSLHLEMADAARSWMVAGRHRDAWIAPRGSGKTLWAFLVLPIWALAHQHRRFMLALSNNSGQAEGHLANIRRELDENDLLLRDFAHLRPSRGRGNSDTSATVTRGPVTFGARGIDSQSLGIRRGNQRPDLLVADEIEPDESNYSPAGKVKRLATLVNAVFAMNTEAAVSLTGYVTMYGSIMHDLVRHARGEKTEDWVAEQGFADTTHYFPAIVTDADGTRRSLWRQRWSLSYLEGIEGTRFYALNFDNNPAGATEGSSWWSDSLFRHESDVAVRNPVMWVDPAVSAKATSDYTAVAIVGLAPDGQTPVVGYCRGFRVGPAERKRKIHDLARRFGVREVHIEINQGGDLWAAHLSPMPAGVRLETHTASTPKQVRIGDLLHHYEKPPGVIHAGTLRDLEDQQRAYPAVTAHDDLVDAVAGAVAYLTKRLNG